MSRATQGRQTRVRGGRQTKRTVRLTADENARLEKLAAVEGISVARLLVERGLHIGDGWTPTQRRALMSGWLEARRDLAGVATNVNQIAHWCNAEQRFAREAERLVALVEDAIARLEAAVGELRRP